MRVSIIVPNYNGKKLLQQNLPEVLAATNKNVAEVIIIDDASTDDSIVFLENFCKENKKTNLSLIILSHKKNLGFAVSVNEAVAHAKGEIVLLLNSDVSPKKDFLTPLLLHYVDKTVFAVGCKDESIEKDKIVFRGRGVGTWQRGFLVHARGEVDKSDTLWVSGGSGAFRKGIWEKLGGFNTLFAPFYWEDIDLSYRAQKAGYKVLFEPKSTVVHKHASGSIQQHFSHKFIKTIAYKNQILFAWLNMSDLFLWISHISWLPYHLIKSLFDQDGVFLNGLFLAFIKIPAVFSFRLKRKYPFTKTDYDIIKNYSNEEKN